MEDGLVIVGGGLLVDVETGRLGGVEDGLVGVDGGLVNGGGEVLADMETGGQSVWKMD